MTSLSPHAHIYRVAQKSKPIPNDKKMVLIILKLVNEIRFFVKLKYRSSAIILLIGIRYSMRDLLSTSIAMLDLQTSDMRQIQ